MAIKSGINERQKAEYVAVSRATDTVTILTNNAKSYDSPLNHLPSQAGGPVQPAPQAQSTSITDQQAVFELANHLNDIAKDLGVALFGSDAIGQFIAQNPTAFRQEMAESNKNSNFAKNDQYERRKMLSQRFSQEELRNGDRITEEAEDLLQRGENSSNPELQKEKTGDIQKGLRQEKELEEWAKEKGIWIDNTTQSLTNAYGKSIAEGGESVVYDNGDKVVKEISLAYFIEPQLALDRIILHNFISDAELTVTNFGRNENGEFVFVVEQPFVKGDQLTQDEIVEYMKSMGFAPYNNRNTEFSNGEILINDLHDENVIKRPNGSITIIDADFRLNTANYGLNGKRTTTMNKGEFSNDTPDIYYYRTPQGEVYGFVDSKGNIYIDEHKIKPEHLMHEYVHLWVRAVMKHNPALWKRDVALMKRTSL